MVQRDVTGSRRQHISVRIRDEFRLIPIRDIVLFRAEQKYVTVCHRNGEELIDESLKALGEELELDFVRVHRSFLVAVDSIHSLEKDSEGKPILRVRVYPDPIPVSRRQLATTRQRRPKGKPITLMAEMLMRQRFNPAYPSRLSPAQ
jgi:two-component system response regulator AlgR